AEGSDERLHRRLHRPGHGDEPHGRNRDLQHDVHLPLALQNGQNVLVLLEREVREPDPDVGVTMPTTHGRLLAPVLTVSLTAASSGCNGSSDARTVPWVDLMPATDTNPDPNIVEIDVEARTAQKSYLEGTSTTVWSYNGTVPGPLIDANVGDTLIVHF